MALAGAGACEAGVTRFCDKPAEMSPQQQDTLLRMGALIKKELDASGTSVAIVSRSGLDLSRFGVRYSHAGVSLKASGNTPWSVRQLYYACDEKRPRVYDQGIAGFLMGTDDPGLGFVSIVFLPQEAAAPLERAALDDRLALALLGGTYSANAYPFSTRYQNCNQWTAELLAAAWSEPALLPEDARAGAQSWLMAQHYAPTTFDVSRWLVLAGHFVPWVHHDDHPPQDVEQARFRISMPSSIESFVQSRLTEARRVEFCHAGRQMVIHRGWDPIGDGCVPGPEDTVLALD
ncbi:DUF2145 domain-containing protein [Piscinibacter terrae]|uniref:DUF2145 domain-containing protein n=1 Tax=Piscinibacter terrae TaxID=2496871 RepID=A0A3N7I0I1_9BURK|nr:DUF2145 domain-containing protein [Albitalea terrae]RQP26881.1 DUF2145 domain-containing protein [Albitalea terrae]